MKGSHSSKKERAIKVFEIFYTGSFRIVVTEVLGSSTLGNENRNVDRDSNGD